MSENKQEILTKLLPALQATSGLFDLVGLQYNYDDESVTATFENGAQKRVNVHMDSGTAMIRDVVGQIV